MLYGKKGKLYISYQNFKIILRMNIYNQYHRKVKREWDPVNHH